MSGVALDRDSAYDVIVIGSGIGGLTAAAFLSKVQGKRVLVLEKHYIPGGLTHSFTRKKYRWDVGVHYVGCMHQGSIQRNIIDYITDYSLDWKKMNSKYERFIYPNNTFSVSDNVKNFQKELFAVYPDYIKEIKKYFTLINHGALWFRLSFLAQNLPKPFSSLLNFLKGLIPVDIHKSTMEYVTEITGNKELSTVLTSQWADYGVSPLEGSFIMHATAVKHYMRGGFVPVGGSQEIFKKIEPQINANGGKVLIRHEVSSIIVENNEVKGVKAIYKGEEKEFTAPVVIANTGAYILYNKLLTQHCVTTGNQQVSLMEPSSGAVIVYLGLKESPQKIGVNSQNIWINKTGKSHSIDELSKALITDKKPLGCFLSFHEKEGDDGPIYMSTIIAAVEYSYFEKWKEQPCMKRDEDYKALKEAMADALIDLADEKLPGIKELIDFYEVGTPLSIEHFSAKRDGCMYGFKTNPEFFPHKVFPVTTEVSGLYQAGTDVCAPGFVAAMMGGLAAAGRIISPAGLLKLLAFTRISGKLQGLKRLFQSKK